MRIENALRGRLSAAQAGYMELEGAVKDGDCIRVYIEKGLSKELGCCNEFNPESSAVKQFKCGTCSFVKSKRSE